jgi:hypothetical protein
MVTPAGGGWGTPPDTAAQVGWKLAVDSLDGWERYRVAGIKVKGFAPLSE